jgi:hypothetical protein
MYWTYANGSYKSNFGLADSKNMFPIGSANDIWDKKVNISETNLSTALNEATKRRSKGPLPDYEEKIYQAILKLHPTPPAVFKAGDIKKADCDLMRTFLREEWDLAESHYQQWKAVDGSGNAV